MLTHDDQQLLSVAIGGVEPLSGLALERVLAAVHVRQLARGEYLLRAGEVARYVGWVTHGLLREHYVLEDGTERTKAFVERGSVTGSAADLLAERSRAYIVAEESVRLLVMSASQLTTLAEAHPSVDAYVRRVLEHLVCLKSEREYELLALDAAARYERFVVRYPGLEGRVAAKHVASYLGITPVHLSRLRRRRRAQ